MKRLLILAICLIIGQFAFAQKINQSEVPASIIKIFKIKMTDSVSVTWEKSDIYYTARFTKSGLKANMIFSESAEWIWTRWELSSQYLPKKVKEYITSNYAGYKVLKAIIEYKQGGEFYLVTLKKKKETPILRFSIKNEFVGVEPAVAVKKLDTPAADKKSNEK